MNTKIKELMEQAQVVYDYAPFYGDMDRDPVPLYKLDPEKFAELIVKECADVAGYYHTRNECVSPKQIKQHFGVE